MRIEYDPQVLSHEVLLERFWRGHDPQVDRGRSQYRAGLYAETEEELALWEKSRPAGPVHTEMLQGAAFYPAEAYHQKWRLRRNGDLFAALRPYYGSEAELLASTTAAKLNGWEHATREQMNSELERLPPEVARWLEPNLNRRRRL